MNDFDQSFLRFQAAEQIRNSAEDWLAAFETALVSRDVTLLGALFHQDCHWRDILAFTWHLTSFEGPNNVAMRLAAEQGRVAAHGFHLPAGAKAAAQSEPAWDRQCRGRSSNSTRRTVVAPVLSVFHRHPTAGDRMKAWLLSTTLETLEGHEEKIGANRPTGAAYSRNFGGDNWADVRRKASAYDDRDPTVLVIGGAQAGLSIAARLNQLGR